MTTMTTNEDDDENDECDLQLSNIIGQDCVSSGYLWSFMGHERVAEILKITIEHVIKFNNSTINV